MRRALLLGGLAAATPAWAADGAALDWGGMSVALLGGLALFLFGMDMMAAALKAVAGDRMRLVLARLTSHRVLGAVTGAAVTAVIQSSSITTVLVVGFVTANLMTLGQAIGVIMGANVGTTITAQIVAFKVTAYALPMIAAGFAMQFLSRREAIVAWGQILMGLGLVFYGMGLMGDGMQPLRAYEPFLALMRDMSQPLLAVLVAALFTALVQSSSATTGIVIVMASQGLIPLPTGIALIFGANVGTCITAMLAAIGKPRNALRAAVVHVVFNVLGVLLWLPLIGPLAEFVGWFSPSAAHLAGLERLAAEVPRQIANAHTVFNVANTLLFIGFTAQFARLVQWLVPEARSAAEPVVRPRHLDDLLLATPALALAAARREVERMGRRVDDMLQEVLPALIRHDTRRLAQIEQMDNEVDTLHRAIIRYLGEISKTQLSEAQTSELIRLMEAVNALENVGDLIETNLVTLGRQASRDAVDISEVTQRMLGRIHDRVAEAVHAAVGAVVASDRAAALKVCAAAEDVATLFDQAYQHQAARLVADAPNRLAAYRLEIDTIERLKQIHSYAVRLAGTVAVVQVPATVA